jgi:hypothetical protein
MQQQSRSKGKRTLLENQNVSLSPLVCTLIGDLMSSIQGVDFKTSYLKSSYLSKYADPSPANALARREAAIAKWLLVEEDNAVTNARIRNCDRGYNILPRVSYAAFVKRCRRTVATILGTLSDDIVIGQFSGGASTSRRRTDAHPGQKYSDKAHATSSAFPYVDYIHRSAELMKKYGIFYSLTEVEGAMLFTVPKNSDIDRCACKEPDLNMYLQRGVGSHIRRRLLSRGINLNDQSINRDLARFGAISGSLATLDLSSASDSITIEIVRELLPADWFLHLNDIRSQRVLVDGDYVTTEMFSSMGNGFTFELESLLFFAIVNTVLYFEGISGRLSVYGDDLVFPVSGYTLVTWALSFFGFKPNHEKSFASGPFRESCGGHYYANEDVTPFYLKRPACRLTDLIRVANQLRRWALCPSSDLTVHVNDPSVYNAWISLASNVPKAFWGGSDYALDTQLVTLDPPRFRLSRTSKRKKVSPSGLHLQWQNSNWNRKQPPLKEAVNDARDSSDICRRRRAPNWGDVTCRHSFIEEVLNSHSSS